MEPVNQALSYKGMWYEEAYKNNNAQAYQSMPLSVFPYAVLDTITRTLENNWKGLHPKIKERMIDSEQYIQKAVKSEVVVKTLLDLDIEPIKKYLVLPTAGKMEKIRAKETARQERNRDTSKGFLSDFEEKETLAGLANLIAERRAWRRLGDGLGFESKDCYAFSDPLDMLKKWIDLTPVTTVSRLYFEINSLKKFDMKYDLVCDYLDAVPLGKIPKEDLPKQNLTPPLERKFSLYHFNRLNEILKANNKPLTWLSFYDNKLFTKRAYSTDEFWLPCRHTVKQFLDAMVSGSYSWANDTKVHEVI
ncbi:MAG: hypothetical protein JSR46_01465, partial [Verrucomicrobia bacterium]|nr:hypothetical protein [Verrucomicrobiota bacterium]